MAESNEKEQKQKAIKKNEIVRKARPPIALYVLEEVEQDLLNASLIVSKELRSLIRVASSPRSSDQEDIVVILTETLDLWPLPEGVRRVQGFDFEPLVLLGHLQHELRGDSNVKSHQVVIATLSTWILEDVHLLKLKSFFQNIQSLETVSKLSLFIRSGCCPSDEVALLQDLVDHVVHVAVDHNTRGLEIREKGKKENIVNGKRFHVDKDVPRNSVDRNETSNVRSTKEPESFRSLTTFKLDLSDRERSERAKLTLPFEEHVAIHKKTKEAIVEYVPDDNDDWDEEDPDDDLDI